MANRTDLDAHAIHGTNPQNLVEKILRMKIYDSMYWKEHCFALTAESLVDKAVDINSLGGTFGGGRKPTKFICLVLKLLQIQPDKEIIVEFIKNDEYKYVRVLGAFYMRLVGRPLEIYNYLEPLYNDYRKLRIRDAAGTYSLSHVDQVVDDMLTQEYLFDIAMPRLPSRIMLERAGQLESWISALDDQFKEQQLLEEAEQAEQEAQRVAADTQREARNTDRLRLKSHHYDGGRRRSRSRERDRDRRRRSASRDREDPRRHRSERERDRTYDREREAERDRDGRKRRRSRSPSRERRREPGGGKSRRADAADMEIQVANEERAKLGLKPLR